jgi:hypothetical protein
LLILYAVKLALRTDRGCALHLVILVAGVGTQAALHSSAIAGSHKRGGADVCVSTVSSVCRSGLTPSQQAWLDRLETHCHGQH